MKRVGHLFEPVVEFRNLLLAARKAFRGKKRNSEAAAFYFDLENALLDLESELKEGRYRPQPYRTFYVLEPKRRQICEADFRDRVVHHAICNILEPILDGTLIFDTYACRKGKGTHAAVKRVQRFSKRFPYFLKCDIRGYFAHVDHRVLKGLLGRKIKDPSLLQLLHAIIDHPVPGSPPGKGLPIGNLTSQVFANLYLGELDHLVKDRLSIKGYVRYMDDFLVFGADKATLRKALRDIKRFVEDDLSLEIKKEVLMMAPVSQGIPFLGFRIFPGTVRLNHRLKTRFGRKIKKRERQRNGGRISEEFFVNSVNSMVAHISHADTHAFRRDYFAENPGFG